MADITEELRVLVTAEVDKAIKNLKQVDKQTNETERIFKSLGKTITAAFAVKEVVTFVKSSSEAYREHNQVISVLESTLKATGATAWTTSQSLQDMANNLQSVTNYSADSINQMQSVLLGFKNISGKTFEDATKAILDMATVMKMDLSSAAQSIGKALDDPIHGMDSLKEQGFNFTAAQKEVIQAFLDTGETAKAQQIILDELSSTFGGAAEAAADGATQIKNALGDVLRAYGHEFSEIFNAFNGKEGKNKIAAGLEWVSNAVKEDVKNWHRMLNFDDWYATMSDTEKLEEASRQIEIWTKKYEASLKSWLPGAKKNAENAKEQIKLWEEVLATQQKVVDESQKATQQENARRDAENEINELMYSIAQNYEKLSKDDPTKQLEAYKKQLVDIGEERKKLSESNATDKDGNIIDTEAAVKQLDYIEKKIWEKIRKIQSDGKKSWQKWFSEITKIDENDFTSGADAAKLYLEQMEREFQTAKSVSEMLGVKFDLNSALKKQQDEIRSTLESLFNIDPSKINEAFTSQDASVQALIDKYKELSKAITETATASKTWEEQLSEAVENIITKLTDLDAQTANVFGNMAVQMLNISLDAAMTGFEEFGRALGEGKDAADSLQAALAAMAQQILNQLPKMFLQAGLQLIAQGQWPLGLGLIAAAGSSAIIAGYVDGKTSSSSTEANALGGVYGADDYAAFAKGGTFTNAIVQSPTFFKFAKGSGFGTGLMGEAGPEAIMPLTRGVDGSLGVNASGIGSGDYSLTVVINNYGNEEVTASESTAENGQRKLEITIGAMINRHLSDGSADRALKSRYGIRAQGV